MHLLRPFAGLRPAPGRARDVIAPPYDVLSTDEARVRAAGKPWSFLHISKPEIDLPVGTDPYSPHVYSTGAQNLERMARDGVLARDATPCYYVYRLIMGEHVQTGLVAAASLVHYASNRIRKHELTTPDKEDDRVRQIEALNAQTGPVSVAYPFAPEIDEILARASAGTPDADATDSHGVRHSLWVVGDAEVQERLTRAFDTLRCIYIADGHHRSAAASRVADARRAADAEHTGDEGYNHFLVVAFPERQMRILDYNRLIADLGGLDGDVFIALVGKNFSVEKSPAPVKPSKPGEFGLFVDGQWYRLAIRPELIPLSDPLGCLDVSLLSDRLLKPFLGITDDGRDKRLEFVGGIRGVDNLERRVRNGEMAAAVVLYPTRMTDMMAVADAGKVMPPKSTWFEPKLVDGLVSHVLD